MLDHFQPMPDAAFLLVVVKPVRDTVVCVVHKIMLGIEYCSVSVVLSIKK